MIGLQHRYPSVDWEPGGSFGGNQTRSAKPRIRRCGCGAIAMTDLLLYVTRHRGWHASAQVQEAAACSTVPADMYDRCCRRLQRAYLPMLPFLGITGLTLAHGLNTYCVLHRLPLRFRWNMKRYNLWQTVEEGLAQDLPVVLSIGPNLPAFWKKEKLTLYRKRGEAYCAAAAVCGHYVTVTAMDGQWLEVSSWGKQYYINREEFLRYGEAHSLFFAHNCLAVRQLP